MSKAGPEYVRGIRHRLGWTQLELATAIGVDPRTIQRWEQKGCTGAAASLMAKLEEDFA